MTMEENFLDRDLERIFRPLGRAGTPGSLASIKDAFNTFAAQRRMAPEALLKALAGDLELRIAVLDGAAMSREEGFFRHPAALEVLGELAREWGTLAPTRALRVLVLNAGRGCEAISLAIALSGQGFMVKEWDVRVSALDISRAAVNIARRGVLPESELEYLSSQERRKHFKCQRGECRVRPGLAQIIEHAWGDPFLETPENPIPSLLGNVDLLLARGFFQDLPDGCVDAFKTCVEQLLTDGGLAFLGPGELWAPEGALSLEERRGVFYFRKGERRPRANKFFQPRQKKAAIPGAPEGAPPSPRLSQLRSSAQALLKNNPWDARELLLEAISSAQEEAASYNPSDYRALSEAEAALGRPQTSALLLGAVELLEKPAS
jgi:chemotaxis methyl-accepting protein methylase